MVRAARVTVQVVLLLCLFTGLQARYHSEKKGHAHDVKPQHRAQMKKLFLAPAIVGVFDVIGHVATVVTVVDVVSSIWDRLKPAEPAEYHSAEEDYDDEHRKQL